MIEDNFHDIDYIDVYDDGPYDIYDIDDYDNDVLDEQKFHKCHDPILKKYDNTIHCFNCKKNRFLKGYDLDTKKIFEEEDKLIEKKHKHLMNLLFELFDNQSYIHISFEKIDLISKLTKIILMYQMKTKKFDLKFIHLKYLLQKILELIELDLENTIYLSDYLKKTFDIRFNTLVMMSSDSTHDLTFECINMD